MLSLSTSEASSCVVNLVSAMVLVWSCLCQIDHSLLLNTLPLIFASVKTGLSSIEWSVCLLCGKSSSFIADLACATKVDGPYLGPVAVRILWLCWMCRGTVVPPCGASVLRCPWLAPSCPCSHWRCRCGALWQAATCCGGVGCDAGHTIVMVWLHPASATTPLGELVLAPLLISLTHSCSI